MTKDWYERTLVDKQCEIERLREANLSFSSTVAVQEREIERLETLINSHAYHDGVSARAEIKRIKALLARAADALDKAMQWRADFFIHDDLIQELREAAK